ncbi:MAG: FAD-dependent oxidoreductase [Candidatus Thorarchaeota archaeon]
MYENERYDVIICGAGVAGSATAIRLMQKNPELKVALIDRGDPIGSKNVSGGVLWGSALEEIIPEWWTKAPIERRIIQKRTGLLTKTDALTVDFHYPNWRSNPDGSPNAVSLLLGKFVHWLAEEAERSGAHVYSGITVDDLSRDPEGRINGIYQADDFFECDVVVIADGANSRLALSSGLCKEMKKEHYGLAVKEILSLSAKTINDRFNNLTATTGLAAEYVIGGLPNGIRAGGFLYTNEETLSLGVIIQIDTLTDPEFPPVKVYETFKQHPHIRNLVEGAELLQYSSHWVPEGGIHMVPQLFDDHVLVVGDAAGLVLSNGMIIQGINYAIESGIMAADTIHDAYRKRDFSRATLKQYERKLDKSVLKDLKNFKNVHKITRNPRLYDQYPDIFLEMFHEMLTERRKPKKHLITLFRNAKKTQKVGWLRLIRDGLTLRHF